MQFLKWIKGLRTNDDYLLQFEIDAEWDEKGNGQGWIQLL